MADAVIALTILSASLTSILGLNSTGFLASQKASSHLTATLIARAVLEDRSIREDQGNFVVKGSTYTWTREVEPRPLAANDVVVVSDIAITVSWQVKSGQNQVTLTTMRWRGRNEQ